MTHSHDQLIRSTLNPRTLELIVLPTEQCNFRCVYCYEDFSIGQMPAHVLDALKKFVANRIDGLSRLSLQWFGGEPLAAKRVIHDFSAFAQNLCRSRRIGFYGALTTNGYLLDVPTARQLHELGQTGYQISLDGHGEGHDRTRRLASGGGTFARIWANLQALRDSDLDIGVVLRIHLTPENLDSVRLLAVQVRREFLHDARFSVLLKPIENLGGPNSHSISSLKAAARSQPMQEMRDLLGLSTAGTPAPAPRADVCYASRPNSFVIRADGRVQKCTVALSEEHNTVGNLAPDGTIRLDKERMMQWMRGYDTLEHSDLHCPAQQFPRSAKHIIPIAVAS